VTAPGPELVDEELAEPGRRSRWLPVLLVGALAAAGAALLVRAAGSGAHSHPSPRPTSSMSARTYGTGAPDSGSGLLAGGINGLPGRTSADPSVCPWPHGCRTVRALPAAVRAAVHAVFTTARISRCTTVRLVTGPLWYRRVEAEVAGGRLVIDIAVATQGGSPTVRYIGATTVLSDALGPYTVTEQFDWPGDQSGVLRRLAGDVRLLAG
jgi:hypothetical protein